MRLLAWFAVLLLMGGCASKEPSVTPLVYDLQHYPQDATAYAENIRDKKNLLSVQQAYETHYFLPWSYASPPQSLDEVTWPFASFTAEKMFGENLRPLPQSWYDTMYDAANFSAYGTINRYAVTLQYANLRNFPTHKPLFKDPKQAGEGFPFDYLQNSGVHANEPLFVSHYSKDGGWAYVFSSYATGWLPVYEIAYIPERYTQMWQEAKQLHITKDNFAIKDTKGRFVFYGRVGMMLPIIRIEKDHYVALSVTAGAYSSPTYTEVIIPKEAGRDVPLALNQATLPDLANQLMQSNYGWGGLYEERDCSSTLRDMYAPFGIWLPRNSYQQSGIGKSISLKELNETEKLERIRELGVPFETLLYRKGHILLYLGVYDGTVMVLHNVWGIKTKNGGTPGRKVIGKTVISSLKLGCKLPDYDEENGLLENIESMNVITAVQTD